MKAWGSTLLFVLVGTALQARASIVYFENFNSEPGSCWSHRSVATTPLGERFLGRDSLRGFSGSELVTLTLDLPAHNEVVLEFDMYVIGSWNGITTQTGKGPDLFFVSVQTAYGPTSFLTSFSNVTNNPQSYPAPFGLGSHAPRTNASAVDELGYGLDSVYHLCLSFPHVGDEIVVAFGAMLSEPLNDESWGLDNVRVSAHPEPSAAILLVGTWLGFQRSLARRPKRPIKPNAPPVAEGPDQA